MPDSPVAARAAMPLVLVAGNPNTGKTTLFNRLTGLDGKVGNYPGVTVECLTGRVALEHAGATEVMDVPGTYSLSARSREEQLAIQAIAGLPPHPEPQLVLIVVDATQLARNLYLVLQVIETGPPVVVALNMVDMLSGSGQEVDPVALERELGVPVSPVCARRGEGLEALKGRMDEVLMDPAKGRTTWRWRPEDPLLLDDVAAVEGALPADWAHGNTERREALALWALLSLDDDDELAVPANLRATVHQRREAAALVDREIDAEVITGRYSWIDAKTPAWHKAATGGKTWTERVDTVLLNPLAGFGIFLLIMAVLFQSLFAWADPAIGWIESGFEWLSGGARSVLPDGLFQDFVTDGLIAGVGSVIVFLPQILMLFFFIGLMEDSGYMSRVAFLMDRLMRSIGLHGRAFVPMLSGFACAVPAIMATRTMERRRDRFLTMMVLPLMTCSARLPVYFLIIAALFPPTDIWGVLPVQSLLMIGMYVFSTVIALIAAAVLGRTLFKGPRVPLILELPPYRRPHWPSVMRMMWQKGRVFLSEAGTVILVCTIALWILLTFPRSPELDVDYAAQRAEAQVIAWANPEAYEERVAVIDAEEQGALLRASYGGRLGRAVEPAIEPLGFDWKIGIGLIGAFAAREVFVSTMGVVYGVGDADESSPLLRDKIRKETYVDGRPVYTPLVGLSLMIFIALACQCMSTLAAVKRETRTYRWPVFMFVYMTGLAWIASFVVYQGGLLLGY
jgi:ferrous iron transport protein B